MRNPESLSRAELFCQLPPEEQRAQLANWSARQRDALAFDWKFWGRPKQQAPLGSWDNWLILAGRGFGKTRTGAEWVRSLMCGPTPLARGIGSHIAIVAETAADARDVMVGDGKPLSDPAGGSGILQVHPKAFRPIYEPSKRRLTWPNGAIATLYNAVEPDQLRGPQHSHAWCDELCFVAGTLIAAEFGNIPIEFIKPGMRVWTRRGLRRVLNCGETKKSAAIWRLETTSGNSIEGTAGHPIFIDKGVVVPLSFVSVGNRVCLKSSCGVAKSASLKLCNVLSVAETSNLLACVRHSAQTTANQLISASGIQTTTVSAVAKTGRVESVFNLEVEGESEYFANGILVHNCKWRYQQETWDQLEFGLRLGDNPQKCITTTPKPTLLLKAIMRDDGTITTRGSTSDNLGNLAAKFIKRIYRKFEGTRLGRQELDAEVLEDLEGALWKRSQIDATRIPLTALPPLRRIVIAIDPNASSEENANEAGIVAAGIDFQDPPHAYVLDDVSGVYSPDEWAKEAISLYRARRADRIVAERNNGGEMVEHVLRSIDFGIPYRSVWASRGKVTRAEPVSTLYEQGRVHHVGTFAQLEDQMTAFTVDFNRDEMGYSPDRLDALVWAMFDLLVEGEGSHPVIV
jgi:predicted phage terminase large subunit-like protein